MTDTEIYAAWPYKIRFLRRECWELIKSYILTHEITSVLEFGSGVSTILLNNLGVDVVSYETDPIYLRKVKSYNLANVEFRLWDNEKADINQVFGLSLVDGAMPRVNQLSYAIRHSRYIAIDDFSDANSSEALYPMVEGLSRLDDGKIKLAIFRKLK
jgi:hypothetical protein